MAEEVYPWAVHGARYSSACQLDVPLNFRV